MRVGEAEGDPEGDGRRTLANGLESRLWRLEDKHLREGSSIRQFGRPRPLRISHRRRRRRRRRCHAWVCNPRALSYSPYCITPPRSLHLQSEVNSVILEPVWSSTLELPIREWWRLININFYELLAGREVCVCVCGGGGGSASKQSPLASESFVSQRRGFYMDASLFSLCFQDRICGPAIRLQSQCLRTQNHKRFSVTRQWASYLARVVFLS